MQQFFSEIAKIYLINEFQGHRKAHGRADTHFRANSC